MLGMMLINSLESGKRITEEEKRQFVDAMEDKDRKPKKEDIVYEDLKKEYVKSKIEGKITVMNKENSKEISDDSTFFVRNSRYDDWRKSNDFKNFNRLDSKPGWYRTDSRRRWMRSGSRMLRSEPGSFSRDRRGKSAE